MPGIVLAIPYYALNWRHVWNHFWINTRGEASGMWNFKGSYWEALKAFTVDGLSSLELSSYLFFFLALVIFSAVFFLHKRKRHDLYLLAGLMAVAVVSLGIIVYGRHDNHYFGLTFQMLLCFAACYCLAALYENKLLFALIVLTFIAFSGWHSVSKPMYTNFSNKSLLAQKGNSINLEVIMAIESHLKGVESNIVPINVSFAFAGEVNATSSEWLALQKSLPLQFSDLHKQGDIAAYKKAVSESDFVVVSDEDADPAGIFHWLPSFGMQQQVLEFLRIQPGMEEIMISKTSRDVVNGYIRVFANKAKL